MELVVAGKMRRKDYFKETCVLLRLPYEGLDAVQ